MAKYKTRNINGVNAVNIGDLGLQYGRITQSNSVPYINADYVDRLIALDRGIGEPYYITSAMGGQHAGGPRGHGAGVKLDLVGSQPGGKFSTRAQDFINKNYIGNGAIGWHDAGSGFHNDITLLGGTNGLNNQPGIIQHQSPQLYNPTTDINNYYNTGLTTNAQLADYMKQYYNDIIQRPEYNFAAARNQAQQNIEQAAKQGVPQINEQMMTGVEEPITMQMREMQAAAKTEQDRQAAMNALANAQDVYNNRLTSEQMLNTYNEQVNRFLQNVQGLNPYNQVQGQVQPYNLDIEALQKAANRDNALRNYMTSAAMMNAEAHPELAAIQMQAAKQGGDTAEQLLRNAQLQYQSQVANKLGIPIDVVNENMKTMSKIAENMAAGNSTAAKEAAIMQPNAIDRTYISEIPKAQNEIYKGTVTDVGNQLEEARRRNELYKDINTPGANALVNTLKEIQELQRKYPELAEKKMEALLGTLSKPDQAIIQGVSGMTGNAINATQKGIGNLNTQVSNESVEQGRNERANQKTDLELYKQATKQAEKEQKQEDPFKIAKQKQSLVNSIRKSFIDETTGKVLGDYKAFGDALANTGIFTQKEIADYVKRYYPTIERNGK